MMRVFAAFLLLFLASEPAMASLLDATGTSDRLLMLIRNSANSWSGVLRGYATDIFWSLAVIQLVWTFSKLALKQTDFAEFAAELVRWIVITGFFFSLVLYSVQWTQAIIDSFRQAGSAAAGVSTTMQPGDMFGLAIELGKTVSNVNTMNPVTAFIVGWSVAFVVVCFSFIAAFMMVTLVEAYFIVNAGVFFMAFGGSEWTRNYSMTMLHYAVAVGAKLLVLQLLVGLIMISAREWQAAFTNDEVSTMVLAGVAFIAAYFCKRLADTVQALITGVSPGGGGELGSMVAAGLAGTAAGAAAMSASMGSGGLLGGAGRGVADLIKSSFSGFTGMGGGSSSPGSFMNSGGGGGGSGGGSSGRSYGQSPRTGGGGYSQAPSTPPSSQPSGQSSSGGQVSSSGSGQATASNGTSTAQKIHAGAHMAADAAVRSVGTMGALAVPGMEGAAGTSIGPAPTPPDLTPIPADTPENIIRPESASPSMAESAGEAPNPAESAPAPANTMASIQEALNNRGKTS